MKEDFHIDSSGRFYENKTTGIAFVGALSNKNWGCALNNKLKEYIKKNLFKNSKSEDYAKLYAICIYYIIQENLLDIKKLIICNDEDFLRTKKFLVKLLRDDGKDVNFNIINITEFRESLGRKVKSLADNHARSYAKRGLKPTRWKEGKNINVIKINYELIKDKWNNLE